MNYPDGMALLAYGDIQNQVEALLMPRRMIRPGLPAPARLTDCCDCIF
jgi:hypothetical protein